MSTNTKGESYSKTIGRGKRAGAQIKVHREGWKRVILKMAPMERCSVGRGKFATFTAQIKEGEEK